MILSWMKIIFMNKNNFVMAGVGHRTDHMIGQKKARNLHVVSQCFLAKLNES